MKIKSFTSTNVKGIPNGTYNTFNNNNLIIFAGENGSGKTTILNIINSILSGTKLPDNWVKKGEKKGTFAIDFINGDIIEISKTEKGSLSVSLCDKKTTLEKVHEYIRNQCYISKNDVIIKYSDVLENMKPKDFTNLIMSKIPVKIEKKDLLSFMSEYKSKTWKLDDFVEYEKNGVKMTEAYNKLTENLPDSFDKEALIILKESYKQNVSFFKKEIERLSSDIKMFESQNYPLVRNAEDIQKDISALNGQKQNSSLIQNAWLQYEQAVKKRKEYQNYLEEKYKELEALKVPQPDEKALEEQKTLLKQWQDYKLSLNSMYVSCQSSFDMIKKALDSLNTSCCPLSDKLVCTVDKTPLKTELSNQLVELNKTIKQYEANIADSNTKIESIQNNISNLQKNIVNWNKYKSSVDNYNQMVKNMPGDPEALKPQMQAIDTKDLDQKLYMLNNELNIALLTLKNISNKENLGKAVDSYHQNNYLVQQLEDDGSIMKNITKNYIKKLNKVIEKDVEISFPNWKFTFMFDDGIVPTVSINGKPFSKYSSLSSGEQAIVALFITDLLNQIMSETITTTNGTVQSGPRTMLIDGLEKLDKNNFKGFIKALLDSSIKENYDNIIINLVNHDDLIETVKANGLTIYELTK